MLVCFIGIQEQQVRKKSVLSAPRSYENIRNGSCYRLLLLFLCRFFFRIVVQVILREVQLLVSGSPSMVYPQCPVVSSQTGLGSGLVWVDEALLPLHRGTKFSVANRQIQYHGSLGLVFKYKFIIEHHLALEQQQWGWTLQFGWSQHPCAKTQR